jgi:GDSL-like Lipase/Acylhydrolase
VRFFVSCATLFLPLVVAPLATAQTPDLSRLVVVGDSLSAGVQNISLLGTQQPNGYAALVAAQAGVPLVLPLIQSPGLPNVLEITGFNPLPVIGAVPGVIPTQPRVNPGQQPFDLAEPGATVAAALFPPSALPPPLNTWAQAVLESSMFPTPPSQVAEAVALHPTTVILWLGNNDALVPALVGLTSSPLTPLPNFTGAFETVISSLAATGATLIVANIPDVTEVAFFTPITRISQVTGLPAWWIANALGTGTGDYLRLNALTPALDILIGKTKGPLPAICPLPYPGFPAPNAPCVLTAADAATVRAQVNSYNAAIATAVASVPKATLVDVHSLINQISQNGYNVPGRNLNTEYLGGLFTLDGIHPTNTAYAILANQFIATMNTNLHTSIPPVNINQIAKHDPLVLNYGQDKFFFLP